MATFIWQHDNAIIAWLLLRIRSWNITCWSTLHPWGDNWFVNSSSGYPKHHARWRLRWRLLSHRCCHCQCYSQLWFNAYSWLLIKAPAYELIIYWGIKIISELFRRLYWLWDLCNITTFQRLNQLCLMGSSHGRCNDWTFMRCCSFAKRPENGLNNA